jgi:predicted transposase YbfD/YdcC
MATKFRLKEHYLKAVQECTDNLRLALDSNAKEYIEKIEEHFLILENKEDLKWELAFPSL